MLIYLRFDSLKQLAIFDTFDNWYKLISVGSSVYSLIKIVIDLNVRYSLIFKAIKVFVNRDI